MEAVLPGASTSIGTRSIWARMTSTQIRMGGSSKGRPRSRMTCWVERASVVRALSPFEQLTMREREVLAALVDGLTAEEIAETHFVALTTVRSQIRAVLQKLGVRSQLAAVAYANRVGWQPKADVSVAS